MCAIGSIILNSKSTNSVILNKSFLNSIGAGLLSGLLALPAAQAANDTSRTVWQIGKFDRSPFEFTHGAANQTAFVVGRDNAARDWPGRQETGQVSRILFSLDSVSGTYKLRIGALIDAPRVPALRIAVNGHAGVFFLHPQLSYARSDFSYAFDPHESESTVDAAIPLALLKAGANEIAITCVDEPPTSPGEKELGGISYDALQLEQRAEAPPMEGQTSIRLEPTIFYEQNPDGLREVVDAYIRFARPWAAAQVQLEAGGKRYEADLSGGEFGESRVSFLVREWSGKVQARVRISTEPERMMSFEMERQRKWTIFVVPHTHLDVGYTDYQGKVAETQARVLTQAGKLIEQHADFRFSMDGSWNLDQLLSTRSAAERDEILNLIRSGKIALPAQNCNLLTGYASLETLYRSLYASRALAVRYHVPLSYANITDVPTYSGSYPSVLASSGVKYWVAGSNNDRAPIFSYDHWNEQSPFWWEGPDGKRVLFWYSRHYMQVQTLFGLPPEPQAIRESLPIYLQAYSRPDYKPDAVLLFGTQVENTDLFPSTAVFADNWNKRFAYPKLQYATFTDFFKYIEAAYANDLATFQGDGGGYWEDGIGSDAYYAQEDRENQNRALSAEILSSVTHSVDTNLNPPVGAFQKIWENLILFSEHTWASWNSVSEPDHEETIRQLRVKDNRADEAHLEIQDILGRSLSQLANEIHIPANTLVVFNSLNWKRNLVVETDLFEHPSLIDLGTQSPVPLEVLSRSEHFLHVRFLAQDVPPVGYKCFRIEYGKQGGPEEAERSFTPTVENLFYRVRVDPETGAVASIYDKQLQRELVDGRSPYKFGQYVYVTGGDGDTQIINPFPALPGAQLVLHRAAKGRYLGAEKTPWGESIRLVSSALNTPQIEAEVLLFNQQKKIEFHYRVHKNETTAKEGVYFAFPAAVERPVFTFATQQQWVDPARNLMKGGSLEWFNIQYWMAVHDRDLAVGIVPIDAALASFGDINRGKWPGVFAPQSATLFSYVMNNYWHTNYRAGQGGVFTFRYAMTSAPALNGNALTRLAVEEMRPEELNDVVSQDKVGDPERPLPAEGKSFLEIPADDVTLITWKRAEDGNGSIFRLQETAGTAAETYLMLPGQRIRTASLCSGVEDDLEHLSIENDRVRLRFKPFEVLTVRIVPE